MLCQLQVQGPDAADDCKVLPEAPKEREAKIALQAVGDERADGGCRVGQRKGEEEGVSEICLRGEGG